MLRLPSVILVILRRLELSEVLAAVHSFCHPPDWKSIAQLWTILRASLRTLANESVKHAFERHALENFVSDLLEGVRKDPRDRPCESSRH